MNLRKKVHNEPEVFTDSLNDIIFILLMFFLIISTMANPNIVKVNNPSGTKDTKAKQNIVVTIDKDQNFFIGTRQIDRTIFDSMLRLEIRKFRQAVDTPTVIINADTAAFYGEVFRVMRIAKRDTAKVAAHIK
jgi:biopolymer transport protein ExbD